MSAAAAGPPAEGAPPPGVLLDLHTHSSERSRDSGVRALTLAHRARELGLAGICLTDHNAVCSAAEARIVGEQAGVVVLPAMEVGTEQGHVLAYGLDRFHPEMVHLRALRRIARAEGAVLAWAHPMRDMRLPVPSWDELPDLFDALEVINGDHVHADNGEYAGLARRLGLGETAGSDAHSVQAVGRAVTAFPAPIPDLAALLAALHARSQVACVPGGGGWEVAAAGAAGTAGAAGASPERSRSG